MSESVQPCRDKWKGSMTDRERFHRQMHFQRVDRCFNMEFGYWEENFRDWPMFVENGVRNNGDADLFFNFDRIERISGKIWMNPAFPPSVVRETETSKIVMDTNGLMAEVAKDGTSTIPRFLQASVRNPDDWKRCKEERFRRDDPERWINVAMIRERHPSDRDYPLGVECGSMIGRIRNMMTVEGLAYACHDYPEMVEDMVETSCLLVEDALDQLLPNMEFEFASGWEDICFNNGPLVSLDFFENVVAPRYKRIGNKLRDAGIDIWYTDCDGDIRLVLPHMIEAGLNCMFPFEVRCSGHPGDLLKKYEGELRIMGGVDKVELARDPAAIKAYLESIAPLVEHGGFIPFCDHRCPPDVSQENYLYYLDLKEAMFGMA